MWSLKQQTPSEWWLNRGEPTLYKPWLLEKWRQLFSTKRNKEVKCINKYVRHTLYKREPGDVVWALAHFPNSGSRAQEGRYLIYDSYSVGQDIACENIRFSSLFVAEDVLSDEERGETDVFAG